MSGRKEEGWGSRIWRGLGSVRLALLLFLVLAIASMVGTFLPQGADPAFYAERFGERTVRWLGLLGLTDPYHSWWFISFLALLSTNLIVCSLQRFPSLRRAILFPPVRIEEERAKTMSLQRSLIGMERDPRGMIEEALHRRGYRLRSEEEPLRVHTAANKGRWGRSGPYLVHVSILIVLFGATVGALFGFRGFVKIPEGGTVDSFVLQHGQGMKRLGFALRCDDFEASFYEGTHRPSDYRSWLTVLENGREVMKAEVAVNSPVTYGGISFYQSSFGSTGMPRALTLVLENPSRNRTLQFRVPMQAPYRVEGTGYTVEVLRFFPDFALDEDFSPFSRSDGLNNPAAEVEIKEEGRSLLRTWVFSKFRDFHPERGGKREMRLTLADYEIPQFTGLQVEFDPGVKWVWMGFALMILGLSVSFLVVDRTIWVQTALQEGKWNITFWGQSHRGREGFEREFDAIYGELQQKGKVPGRPISQG